MNVLLISANSIRIPYYVYPLGLDYVAASIPDRHRVAAVDVNEAGVEGVCAAVREFTPDVIGVSIRNIDNTDAADRRGFIRSYRDLIGAVREFTSAPIVLGGSGFTLFPRRLLAELRAEYGIIGEGERFGAFIEAIESGRDPRLIPGVITANGDESPPPPLERVPPRLHASFPYAAFYAARGGMMNLQSKRGCSFRCIYCTYPRVEGSRLRYIPADEVAETALALERAGARYLFITDSVFNTSHEHTMEVARAFIRKGVSVPWGAFFAPLTPPPGYYTALREAGLTHVEFGTEALSDVMLASYRKPFTVADVFAAHKAATEAGAYVAHYLLLGGPGEDRRTVEETIRNAARLEKTVIFFFCGIRIYPHTELYEIAVREGQIAASDDLLDPVFYQSRAVSSDEIIRMVRDAAQNRENWIIGSGGAAAARMAARLHRQGRTGPLWEYLIR